MFFPENNLPFYSTSNQYKNKSYEKNEKWGINIKRRHLKINM